MTVIRLLLDENLSEAVIPRIAADYPGCTHVRLILGEGAPDRAVWDHARTNGLVLVTRDEDFQRLSVLHGAPPKVIWLAGHNLPNREVVAALRSTRERIERFVADTSVAMLVIGR